LLSSISSLEELDLVSWIELFFVLDLSGGLGGACFVLEGDVSEDETLPTINACSLGDAGASRGDNNNVSEGDMLFGEEGEMRLETELSDSLLGCLL